MLLFLNTVIEFNKVFLVFAKYTSILLERYTLQVGIETFIIILEPLIIVISLIRLIIKIDIIEINIFPGIFYTGINNSKRIYIY